MRLPRTTSDRVALTLLILGFVVLGVAGLLQGPKFALKAGPGCWLLAYFIVLVENLKSRRAVSTRGGIVRAEDGRWAYLAPYYVMFLFGAIGAVVLV